MRALVTGATGFIGGHLVERLRAEGWSVAALIRPGSDRRGVEGAGADAVEGDVSDVDRLRTAARGCAAVFHLAGARTSTTRDRSAFHAVNVRGTGNALQAALDAGVERFVLASSTGVYGAGSDVIGETAPLRPDTPYRLSRLEAERMALAFHRDHGLPVVVARVTTVYGPGNLDYLPLFVAVAGGAFVLPGSGRHPYHASYVGDVVEGLLRCAGPRARAGEAYNIGSTGIPSMWEFVQAIADAVGVPVRRRPWLDRPLRAAAALDRAIRPLGLAPARLHRAAFFTQPRAWDLGKARRELGLPESAPVRVSVGATLDWYRAHGHV